MQSAAVQYDKEIKKHLRGYRGTWLPNTSLKLGAYGTFIDGQFSQLGCVEDFEFDIEHSSGKPAHINFCSSNEIKRKYVLDKRMIPSYSVAIGDRNHVECHSYRTSL